MQTFFRYLLALFWIFAGINHFLQSDFYVSIMPHYFSYPFVWVQISGIIEIFLGIMVTFRSIARIGGWLIIGLLTLFLLVHIDMLIHAHDRYQDIPYTILWLRLPLQALFAYWAWWSTRPAKN